MSPAPQTPVATPRFLRKPSTPAETKAAARDLGRVLSAAGLGTNTVEVRDDANEQPSVHLHGLDTVETTELTRLLRKAIRRDLRTASELHDAARARGLDDFPTPRVHDRMICLGDVSVVTADRLACLLGAPHQPRLVPDPDWPEAQQVLDRLHTAFKQVTGGQFMDLYLHPYCARCEGETAVTLGDLTVTAARRLTTALRGDPT